ncbi:MAG: iron-containing alcohol dehydrogenase, partial [Halanaerobiaceae bacterium]|nr:iron-containing alcohol dehydrogenase [Halanaerobiaceae bacterium]
ITELGGVQPNPRLKLVKEGIRLCRENNIDLILAVGGGSVIDSAKAISIGVNYEGDVWDFYSSKAVIKEALPVGVVLTIPAAGSESSPASVITREEGSLKRDCGSDLIRPKFAILNPELTYTLPDYQTVCGAADIMAHALERYFTQSTDVDITDRLLESVLKTMIRAVPLVLNEPENYGLRAQIMWAGAVVHNGLLGTGRIEDWASHMIEHELSGIYDVPHGAGLAVVFPAWMKYVYRENIQHFVQYAVRVWGVENDFQNPERTALEGIRKTKDFFSSIGLPTTLQELEIADNRLEEMAEKCTENGPVGNFKKLYYEDVLNIYKLAR